jgi:hypothetical protein
MPRSILIHYVLVVSPLYPDIDFIQDHDVALPQQPDLEA